MAKQQSDYWFKGKRYGWGWYPATWQGWAILFGFIAVMVINSMLFGESNPALFLTETFVLVGMLILICYKTGEKPRWRWGK